MGILPVNLKPPKGPLFILGTLFLKKYYAIFDIENKQIGFSLTKTSSKKQYNIDDYQTEISNSNIIDGSLEINDAQNQDTDEDEWKLVNDKFLQHK